MFYRPYLKTISDYTSAQIRECIESRLRFQHCTEPANRKEAEAAVIAAYNAAGLAPPKVLWCKSPLEAYLARAIIRTLNSNELTGAYKQLTISDERERSILGDCVRHFIRDEPLGDLHEAIDNRLSPVLKDRLLAIGANQFQDVYRGFNIFASTITETINRVAYIENARAVQSNDGSHIEIPDAVWEAACGSAEKIMGAKIPEKLRGYRDLSCVRWPYFFNSIRDSTHSTGYGAHDTGLLTASAYLKFIPFFSIASNISPQRFDNLVKLSANAGWYLPHRKVCWIAERHTEYHFNDRERPHNESGPAIAYPDGWSIYAWHGARVPKDIIMQPEKITIERIDSESNAELKSVMIQRFGEERYFNAGDLEQIDHDPRFGTLLKRKGSLQMTMVRVINSTAEPDGSKKTYLLRVPEWMRTAREAVAWTFNMNEQEYNPNVET